MPQAPYTGCRKSSATCRSCKFRSYCERNQIECQASSMPKKKRPHNAAATQSELFNMEPRAQEN